MSLRGGGAAAASATSGSQHAPQYLSEHMHEWRAFATLPSCRAHLQPLTGLLRAVPLRPVTLDTALQWLPEPDVSHRCPRRAEAERASAPGVVGGFKSLFGFGR
jgi:hypothetical protein